MACSRSAPVMMILATSESKVPGTVMPLRYPSSTRTPGPAGARQLIKVPGAGRKLRPGSSALIRNSMECPVITGSS